MSTDALEVLNRARELNGVTDEATATAALHKVRDDLTNAVDKTDVATDQLRDLIVSVRPSGVLTVDEMAEAVGRDRNFIDSVWSTYGEPVHGKQTRVPVRGDVPEEERTRVVVALADAASALRQAKSGESLTRVSRDRVVAMVYASKILGPSAIAAAVVVDRNHVLRIARKAGIPPQHRTGAKNQHSKGKRKVRKATA